MRREGYLFIVLVILKIMCACGFFRIFAVFLIPIFNVYFYTLLYISVFTVLYCIQCFVLYSLYCTISTVLFVKKISCIYNYIYM